MGSEEIEEAALKLDPRASARLASKLLASLETLSDHENERLWAEEAERRDAELDARNADARSASDVLRDATGSIVGHSAQEPEEPH